MPNLKLPGAELWYEDAGGNGQPVIFIHPGSSTSRCWEHQVLPFSQAGFRPVIYDLRGRGKSKASLDDAGHQIDDLDTLARHLGFDRFALVAAAGGGYTGVDYALNHADRLLALVISGSHSGLDHDPIYRELKRRVVPKEMDGLPTYIRELGPAYRAANPEGVARWQRMSAESGREGGVRQTLKSKVTLAALNGIKTPTLVIAGGADLLTPPPMMQLIAGQIPASVFVTISDVGHSAHWEAPEEWNRIIMGFLQERAPARSQPHM